SRGPSAASSWLRPRTASSAAISPSPGVGRWATVSPMPRSAARSATPTSTRRDARSSHWASSTTNAAPVSARWSSRAARQALSSGSSTRPGTASASAPKSCPASRRRPERRTTGTSRSHQRSTTAAMTARAPPVPGATMPSCAGPPPSGTAEAATRATREGSRGAMGSGCYSATGAESGATTHGFRSRAARRARVHQVLPPRRAVVCAHRWGERTMIRRHLLLLLVALLVGVPAACGDDGGSSGDGEAAEEPAEEQAADEGADDEAAGEDEAAAGGGAELGDALGVDREFTGEGSEQFCAEVQALDSEAAENEELQASDAAYAARMAAITPPEEIAEEWTTLHTVL